MCLIQGLIQDIETAWSRRPIPRPITTIHIGMTFMVVIGGIGCVELISNSMTLPFRTILLVKVTRVSQDNDKKPFLKGSVKNLVKEA